MQIGTRNSRYQRVISFPNSVLVFKQREKEFKVKNDQSNVLLIQFGGKGYSQGSNIHWSG